MKIKKSLTTIMTSVVLVGVMTHTSVTAAGNGGMDGKTLQTLCSGYLEASLTKKLPQDSSNPYMRCVNYMQGLVESSLFYERMMYTVSGNHIFCFPRKEISTAQAILVTNEYLKKHPEKLDSQAVVLVMAAFFESYSCS